MVGLEALEEGGESAVVGEVFGGYFGVGHACWMGSLRGGEGFGVWGLGGSVVRWFDLVSYGF